MTSMTGGPEPLKTDAVGRVRTPAAKRAEILAAFERSGVSGAEFAALVEVKYSTFAAWLQARRQSQAPVAVIDVVAIAYDFYAAIDRMTRPGKANRW